MLNFEKKIINWLEQHIDIIFVIVVSLGGLLIRYPLRKIESMDMTCFLLPWYEEFRANGGLSALKHQVGDYNVAYQLLISIMTYIPVNPIIGYKAISAFFDYILAFAGARIVYVLLFDDINKDSNKRAKQASYITYACLLFSMVIVSNSAVWGQCDSIYTAFVLLSILKLIQNKNISSFIFLGLAFSFKLQTVFIIPFFLLFYIIKKSYSILMFLEVPVVMMITGIPAVILGGRSPLCVFEIYMNQTNSYQVLYLNYPSFWCFLPDNWNGNFGYYWYRTSSIFLTMCMLLLIAYIIMKNKAKLTGVMVVRVAMILVYTCVFFLSDMHDRYGYMYEVLSILLAVMEPRFIIGAVALNIMSLYLYSGTIGVDMIPVSMQIVAWINVAIYVYYLYSLIKDIRLMKEKEENAKY